MLSIFLTIFLTALGHWVFPHFAASSLAAEVSSPPPRPVSLSPWRQRPWPTPWRKRSWRIRSWPCKSNRAERWVTWGSCDTWCWCWLYQVAGEQGESVKLSETQFFVETWLFDFRHCILSSVKPMWNHKKYEFQSAFKYATWMPSTHLHEIHTHIGKRKAPSPIGVATQDV